MSGRPFNGRSAGLSAGSAAVAAPAADAYLQPRGPGWFRARLALRLAVPIDPAARLAAWRLAVSAALLAPPVMILLTAPRARLTSSALIALCCVALPGAAGLLWSAAALRETRQRTARGLRQAGAERPTAWLMAAGRPALFAAAGAVCGATCMALLHAPLIALLPRHAPLHGMLGAGTARWLTAIVETVVLCVATALVASTPLWRHRDRRRRERRNRSRRKRQLAASKASARTQR